MTKNILLEKWRTKSQIFFKGLKLKWAIFIENKNIFKPFFFVFFQAGFKTDLRRTKANTKLDPFLFDFEMKIIAPFYAPRFLQPVCFKMHIILKNNSILLINSKKI